MEYIECHWRQSGKRERNLALGDMTDLWDPTSLTLPYVWAFPGRKSVFPHCLSQFELGYVETEGFLHDQLPSKPENSSPLQESSSDFCSLWPCEDDSRREWVIQLNLLKSHFPKDSESSGESPGPWCAKAADRACWLQTQSDGLLYSIITFSIFLFAIRNISF